MIDIRPKETGALLLQGNAETMAGIQLSGEVVCGADLRGAQFRSASVGVLAAAEVYRPLQPCMFDSFREDFKWRKACSCVPALAEPHYDNGGQRPGLALIFL